MAKMTLAASNPPAPQVIAPGTDNAEIIDLWTHGKSKNTADLYRRVATLLLTTTDKPLQWLTLQDFQYFADTLEKNDLSPSSRRTYISVVKSLQSFGHRTGLIQVNAAAALVTPKPKDTLSQKILSELEVLTMIALEPCERNKLILKTFYYAGLRASELCDLNWEDLSPNAENGQLLIYGKGEKSRVVLLPKSLYIEILNSRGKAGNSEPIFRSRKAANGGRLHRISVTYLVKEAAKRAGISEKTSAHWLRHCHASHALNRGAPIHLLSQTLGHASIATTSRYLHAKPNDSSGLYLIS
ncbi:MULTISPECIES: tyrosine-type recombinase/integrase [unclassified Microcoleus]|uniref:tyrosine-type recombinase/integrase n=1 Tax=unclassified Microcoleus TaxID=2642155 RepID=UPI004040AB53